MKCVCWIEEKKEYEDNHLRWWPCLGCGTKKEEERFLPKAIKPGRYTDRYYEYRSEV